MGCDHYQVNVPQSGNFEELRKTGFTKPATFGFGGEDEDRGCVCTFPSNWHQQRGTVPVEQLALLGAAIVLAYHRDIPEDGPDDGGTRSVYEVVPDWIQQGIRRALKVGDAH